MNPMKNIISCRLIGMPQTIAGPAKCIGKGIRRRIQAVFLKYIHECEIHIQIIVEIRIIQHGFFQVAVVPKQWLVISDKASFKAKLIGPSKRNADGLTGPATSDLILQSLTADQNIAFYGWVRIVLSIK